MSDPRWSWSETRLICPLVSPLREDGAIDTAALGALVEHVLAGGVDGLFVLGTSGEGPWLPLDEQRRLANTVVSVVDGRVPILAGALEASTARVLHVGRMLLEAGVDALAVTAPYYFEPDADAVTNHVETVAEAFKPVPIVLYNIPQATHVALRMDRNAALAAVPNIVGIKDSSGDGDALQAAIAVKEQRPQFAVWQGAELLAVDGLRAGANGLVPGLSNLRPQMFRGLIDAFDSDDGPALEGLQLEIAAAWEIHRHGFWLDCLKFAAHALGFGSGRNAGAINALSPEARSRIMTQLGLEVHGATP